MKIGIIGAGQLGRMLALAGYPLGTAVPVPRLERGFARRPGRADRHRRVRRSGAASSGSRPTSTWSPTNSRTCRSTRCEHVAATRPCLPPVEALRVSQDRLLEKKLFARARHPDAAVPRGGLARGTARRRRASSACPAC